MNAPNPDRERLVELAEAWDAGFLAANEVHLWGRRRATTRTMLRPKPINPFWLALYEVPTDA